VEHFGTFRGLGEGAGYLSDLGVTAVELLPVHEKPGDGGYWGYNNLSWFAPETTYSAAWQDGGEPVEQIDEFKGMVDALHAQGVEVILDVVYNHTGEGGLWRTKLFFDDPDGDWLCNPGDAVNLDSQEVTSLLGWRGLDSSSYYVLENANQGYFDGSTGVGNQCRANFEPMQRQILDSLRYMVEELHVDGFRFDLAAVLGEADGAAGQYWSDPTDTTLNLIADDPVLQQYHTRIIAEPWSLAYDASTQYPMSSNDPAVGWSEWNGNFRDWWRRFLDEDGWALNAREGAIDGGGALTGSADRYGAKGKHPYDSVNFVTVHDGFTMFDLFSYETKENGCGPLNPVCCYDECSAWCDPTSGESNNHSRNWGGADESQKRQIMRDAFVGLLLSQGTPLILGGDEWMRTQYGNNNAWTSQSDNEWAWFRWGEWTSENKNNVFRHRMHDFVRQLIALRKRHEDAFAPTEYGGGPPITWLAPSGAPADGATWGGRSIQMVHGGDDPVALLINMEAGPVTFTLPPGSWEVAVDTQAYYDLPGRNGEPTGYFDDHPDADPFVSANIHLDGAEPVTGSYTLQPRTIVVLESR
jgi:glycogen operon protein